MGFLRVSIVLCLLRVGMPVMVLFLMLSMEARSGMSRARMLILMLRMRRVIALFVRVVGVLLFITVVTVVAGELELARERGMENLGVKEKYGESCI